MKPLPVALVLLSPVLAVVWVLVRLRMGHPVLFRQQRPGRHGRPFVARGSGTGLAGGATPLDGNGSPSIVGAIGFGSRIRAGTPTRPPVKTANRKARRAATRLARGISYAGSPETMASMIIEASAAPSQ